MTARGLRGAVATVALCSLGAYLGLELWNVSLADPLRYSQVDDTKFYFALVKDILEHGWYLHNPDLGAPFGQELYDFPQGADNLNLLAIKALGLFSSSYAVVTNVFFLLTFPACGLAAYWALRRCGLQPAVAAVCATLFALLPYHFFRHESQLLLSAYYAVPLAAYLFLSLFAGPPPGRVRTVVLCLAIGSAGLYYAVFSVLMLVGGALVALAAGRGRRVALGGGLAALLIAATLTVNLAPSLIYAARHGGDGAIARAPVESEQMGLRLSTLLLPVRHARLPPLHDVNARYAAATSPGYCESCNASLGTVGAIGFVVLGLVALAGIVGVAGAEWQRPFRAPALGAALAFAIGTVGGISGLIAFLLDADVRAWNRISLFIAFFSLVAVGLLLEQLGRRIRGPRRAAVAAAGLAVVLILGGLDETSNFFVPDSAAAARAYHSDQDFGRAIEAHVAPGSSIFELPYVPFPEGFAVPGVIAGDLFTTSYELLRPYLNTTGLRFSFGAIKGRPADWEAQLRGEPLDVVVAAAAAAGFEALYVDPRAYAPATAARVRARLTRLLGAGPLVSELGDAWLFDMRPYLRRLRRDVPPAGIAAARTAALDPLRTGCGGTPDAVTLTNPSRSPRPATFAATLRAPHPGPAVSLDVSYPDGGVERVRVAGGGVVHLHRTLTLAPGAGTVRVALVGATPFGASPATPAFAIVAPRLTERAFGPLVAGAAGAPIAGLVGPSCGERYAASAASHLATPALASRF